MNVADYLERIDVAGPVRADLATLDGLHRAHLDAVPFENLDVQLERPVSQDIDAIFDKIVRRRRGGWCFEMKRASSAGRCAKSVSTDAHAGGVMREGVGAIVTARLWIKAARDGAPFERRLWFSDTDVRTPQGWRAMPSVKPRSPCRCSSAY